MRYEIKRDESPENPFDWDNGFAFWTNIPRYFPHFNLDGVLKYWEPESDKLSPPPGYTAYPVYAYIHSGIVLSLSPFSCPWDSGFGGVLLLKRSEFITKKSDNFRIRKIAKGFIETFNQYLAGDIWGYTVYDDSGEMIDSLWGIYGRDEAEKMAKEVIEDNIRDIAAREGVQECLGI